MGEINTLADLLRQHGPLGIALILMGAGLVYLLRWLRSEQDRAGAERKEAHEKFAATLEHQGERHERIMTDVSTKFTNALERQGERIDALTDRVDQLDDHVRGK